MVAHTGLAPPVSRVEIGMAETRAEIVRLDREASVLRNRSQITVKTRARIDTLTRQSARLCATLPEFADMADAYTSKSEETAAQFAQGRALFQDIQAPALCDARLALRALLACRLPPALEREITDLIAGFDRHTAGMNQFNPSQGLPAPMRRLLSG